MQIAYMILLKCKMKIESTDNVSVDLLGNHNFVHSIL